MKNIDFRTPKQKELDARNERIARKFQTLRSSNPGVNQTRLIAKIAEDESLSTYTIRETLLKAGCIQGTPRYAC